MSVPPAACCIRVNRRGGFGPGCFLPRRFTITRCTAAWILCFFLRLGLALSLSLIVMRPVRYADVALYSGQHAGRASNRETMMSGKYAIWGVCLAVGIATSGSTYADAFPYGMNGFSELFPDGYEGYPGGHDDNDDKPDGGKGGDAGDGAPPGNARSGGAGGSGSNGASAGQSGASGAAGNHMICQPSGGGGT